MNKEKLIDLINNFSDYTDAYNQYKLNVRSISAFLWLLYLTIFAQIGLIFPKYEIYLTILLITLSFFIYNYINKFSNLIMKFYIFKINKKLGEKILFYHKYEKVVRLSMKSTLKDGGDNFIDNILEKISNTINK